MGDAGRSRRAILIADAVLDTAVPTLEVSEADLVGALVAFLGRRAFCSDPKRVCIIRAAGKDGGKSE